ncbi:MAG TPA: rhodanese-like domain-containing protein [Pyrinomonadaceae bacterium]|jgi:3-mercaptopyruvate sulfurtransferase SseA|nr:rhodanese-like domain-containing protein [Pyrinomonadaceae bacterium]
MRVAILLSFSFIIAVGVLAACNSHEAFIPQTPSPPVQTPQPKNPADDARRITAEELHKLWEKKDVLIIDTRGEPDYKAGHIPGAISVPANVVATKVDELPRNKMIVAYCT